MKVIVAALINLGNTASYLVSVPFVGFMVLSFYPTLEAHEVGCTCLACSKGPSTSALSLERFFGRH